MAVDLVSSAAFADLVSWIEEETGLTFPEAHLDTVARAAESRAASTGGGLAGFLAELKGDEAARRSFLSDITIGETYFFRDERQFAALLSYVLPASLPGASRLIAWSATCATGEEAVSVAAAIERARVDAGSAVEYKVIASDINAASLSRLSGGLFPASSFRGDGSRFHELLDAVGTRENGPWRAGSELMRRIEPRLLNILTDSLPEEGSVDIAFFRNTLVYMKQEQKDRAMDRVAKAVRPGGFLFLASPEVPSVRHPDFDVEEREGCFFFRKRDPSKGAAAAERPAKGERLAGDERKEPAALPKKPRARPRPRAAIGSDELARGIRAASSRLSGAEIESLDGRGAEVAAAIEAITDALHRDRYSKAEELLDSFEAGAGETWVGLHLRALARKHRGLESDALALWERARDYDRRCWPAAFHLGMTLAKRDPVRAAELLGEARAGAEASPDGGRDLLAVLEGFDARYYARMADRMLTRLGKGE